jgi:hypothetical protein
LKKRYKRVPGRGKNRGTVAKQAADASDGGTVWLEQRYRLEWLSWHFLAHGGRAVKF